MDCKPSMLPCLKHKRVLKRVSDFHNLIAAIEDKDNSGYLDMIEKNILEANNAQ